MACMQQTDPVLEALGMNMMNQQSVSDQEWMAYQQAAAYDPSLCCDPNYIDPNQLAWAQAQAMIATAWQLQQMASLSAQAAAAFGANACTLPSAAVEGGTTPRTTTGPASEATPPKTGASPTSDLSTAPGSPSGDVESEEDSENGGRLLLSPVLLSQELSIPPPPPTPTKLDLHAIIFEKAKDPMSAGLLSLIKGNQEEKDSADAKEKGKAILDLLNSGETTAPPRRTGPLASGAHRRAAVAARQAAEKAAAAAAGEEEESAPRRRRPRGGRGGRGNRSSY